MSDNPISYSTRVHIKNPSGAYDPAPLHEFDLDGLSHPPTLVPGDVICSWSRLDNEPEGQLYYFKVVERVFRFDATEVWAFVLVEEVSAGWTEQLF